MSESKAEQIDRERYAKRGEERGRAAERARCEDVLEHAIKNNIDPLRALAAIEDGTESAAFIANSKSASQASGRDAVARGVDLYLTARDATTDTRDLGEKVADQLTAERKGYATAEAAAAAGIDLFLNGRAQEGIAR